MINTDSSNFFSHISVSITGVCRMVVVTSSSHIVEVIESLGLVALHHPSFAATSRHASLEYLDDIFVDMMWYKVTLSYIIYASDTNTIILTDVVLIVVQCVCASASGCECVVPRCGRSVVQRPFRLLARPHR